MNSIIFKSFLFYTIINLLACSQATPSSPEMIIIECINNHYKTQKIDYQQLSNEVKNVLKANNIIPKTEPLDFDTILTNFAKVKNKRKKISRADQLKIDAHSPKNIGLRCGLNDNKIDIENSKLAQLNGILKTATQSGSIDFQKILTKVSYILQPEDFKIPLYQELALWLIYEYSLPSDRIISMMGTTINPEQVVKVLVEKNQILINNEVVTVEQITQEITSKLRLQNEFFVSLSHKKGVEYDHYKIVYDAIEKAYSKVWNDLAQEKFQKSYDMLTKNDQKIIHSIIPKRISESEPN